MSADPHLPHSDPSSLNEYDANEWYDISRKLKPDLTREEFDKMWEGFQAAKAEHLRQQKLN